MSQQAKSCMVVTGILVFLVTFVCLALGGLSFIFSWPLGLFGLDYPLLDTLGPFTPALFVAAVSVGAWLLAARFTESTRLILTMQLLVVLLYLGLGVALSFSPVLTPFRIGDAMHNKPAAGKAGIASRLAIGYHWPGVPEPERWAIPLAS